MRSVPDVLEPAVSALHVSKPSEVEEQIAGADAFTFEDALVGVRLSEDRFPARPSGDRSGHEVWIKVSAVVGPDLAIGEFRDETAVG